MQVDHWDSLTILIGVPRRPQLSTGDWHMPEAAADRMSPLAFADPVDRLRA